LPKADRVCHNLCGLGFELGLSIRGRPSFSHQITRPRNDIKVKPFRDFMLLRSLFIPVEFFTSMAGAVSENFDEIIVFLGHVWYAGFLAL